MRSLEFTVKRILIKLFRTYDNVIIDSCVASFSLATVSELVDRRKNMFLLKLNLQDNLLSTNLMLVHLYVGLLTVVAVSMFVCLLLF